MQGLKHVYIYYIGKVPEKIELYSLYENRECLHCHDEARSFEENEMHVDMLTELRDNEISCLECRGLIHNVSEQADLKLWEKRE